MNRGRWFALSVFAFTWFSSSRGAAQSDLGPFEITRGPVKLQITGVRKNNGQMSARLSDSLIVWLEVSGLKTFEVEPVGAITSSADWDVTIQPIPSQEPRTKEKLRWCQAYKVSPVRPGNLTLPLAPLRFREVGAAAWETVHWPLLTIRVSTEITNPSLSQIQDSIPPEEPLPPQTHGLWWAWPFLGLALAALMLAIVRVRQKRRAMHLVAKFDIGREIESLVQLPLDSSERILFLHMRLSEMMRLVLRRKDEAGAATRTTAELLGTSQITGEQQERVREILEACDLVKFARVIPTVEDCRRLAIQAAGLVSELSMAAAELGEIENKERAIG
jgi:hypothetical protein